MARMGNYAGFRQIPRLFVAGDFELCYADFYWFFVAEQGD